MGEREIVRLKEMVIRDLRQHFMTDLRPTDTLNLNEAAHQYGKGAEAIRTAIRRHKLEGFKGGDGKWYAERSALDTYFGKKTG